MIRRPPRSTRTDTLFPYTTLFRSFEGRCQLRSPWLTILLSRKLNFNLHVSRITTNEPSPSKRAAVLPAKIWLPQNKSMHTAVINPIEPNSSRAERTRAAILAAAEELFASRGFATTRLQDVADAVKMTRAALFYYFKDKQSLFDAG